MLWPQKTRYLALAVVFGLGSMTAGGSADSRPREPSLAGVIETARLTVLERLQNGNEVRALVRDGDRVWVATSAGLAILKKGGLVAVGGSESLGLLNMLYLDQDNTLWVGGKRGAMRFRVHGGVDAGSQGLRLERLERVAGIDVRAMQRHRGQLYVGSWGRGPFVWKAGKLRSLLPPRRWRRSKRRLALLNVSALLEANGRLYVGTVGGGVAVLRARKNDKRLPRLRRLPSRGHAERMVWDLCRGAKGVWAASSAGLRHFVGRRERRRHALVVASKTLPVRDLRTVMCGGGPGPETLWVGSYGGGVYRLSGKTSSRMRFVSMRERVVALAKGKSELLVGTTAGLIVHDQTARTTARIRRQGPRSNDVSALLRSKAGLWIGTFDRGLSLYTPRNGRYRHFGIKDGLIDSRINHLAIQTVAGKEAIWVATPRGVSRYFEGRWTRFSARDHLAKGHANAVYVAAGAVYVASGGGVSVYKNGRFGPLGGSGAFPLRSAIALHRGKDGALWVGGIDGLARYYKGRWHKLSVASGHLPDDWVTALAMGPRGRLWVGTYDGGLAVLDPRRHAKPTVAGGQVQHYTERRGLPCGWINFQAVTRVGRRLLFGTLDGGLMSFRDGRVSRVGLGDGLPSADVTAVLAAAREGELWIATRRGVVRARFERGENKSATKRLKTSARGRSLGGGA